jgi:hypothetical protein
MSGAGDPDSSLQILTLSPQEHGATFSLEPETYCRLASACLSVATDLMTIRRLGKDLPGAIIDLYSNDYLLRLTVQPELKAVSLDLFATLDSPEAGCLLSVEDSLEGWQRIRHTMHLVSGGRQ